MRTAAENLVNSHWSPLPQFRLTFPKILDEIESIRSTVSSMKQGCVVGIAGHPIIIRQDGNEKLAVIDVYHNSLTDLAMLVENVGNVEANIADVFVNGKPVSSMNGIISSPRIPFILETGGVQTVRLSFSSPLSPNANYEVSIRTEIGSNYTGTVTIP